MGLKKLLPLGNIIADTCRDGRNAAAHNGQWTLPDGGQFFTLALVPATRTSETPQLLLCGGTMVIEMQLPSGQPGLALACRIHANARDVTSLQRRLNRAVNHQQSGRVIAGMILLLAMCGWIAGGNDGARQAVSSGAPLPDDAGVFPEIMLQQLGAQLLHPSQSPALFDILRDICRRAGLTRLPDLYCLPYASTMNAYALGGPRRSAITLTDGLLRGMTLGEIAAILAHEVAHISNSDARAMSWATTLHRAIAVTSLTSLATLQRQDGLAAPLLSALLSCASAIGQLLYLALSRILEFDADATALELIDDPQALVSALHKLERHHNAVRDLPAICLHDGLLEFLRSHPATRDRVGTLRRLAPSM